MRNKLTSLLRAAAKGRSHTKCLILAIAFVAVLICLPISTISCKSNEIPIQSQLNSVVLISTDYADGSGAWGSGVIYDKDGYILTNRHVIEGASEIEVYLFNGTEVIVSLYTAFQAHIIRIDPVADLAIIKISSTADLPKAALGKSANVKMLDKVWALGYPIPKIINKESGSFGSPTASDGTVSRIIESNIIQTNCAINPGNSGGALLNSNNEVIGIIFLRSEKTADGRIIQGIGYAIAIDYARSLISSKAVYVPPALPPTPPPAPTPSTPPNVIVPPAIDYEAQHTPIKPTIERCQKECKASHGVWFDKCVSDCMNCPDLWGWGGSGCRYGNTRGPYQ